MCWSFQNSKFHPGWEGNAFYMWQCSSYTCCSFMILRSVAIATASLYTFRTILNCLFSQYLGSQFPSIPLLTWVVHWSSWRKSEISDTIKTRKLFKFREVTGVSYDTWFIGKVQISGWFQSTVIFISPIQSIQIVGTQHTVFLYEDRFPPTLNSLLSGLLFHSGWRP